MASNTTSGKCRRMIRRIVELDTLDLTLRMTVLLLLMHHGPAWYSTLAIALIAVWGIIDMSLLRRAGFWLLVAALQLIFAGYVHWHISNNHDFLIGYWCLALAVSLYLPNSEQAAATNARLLIGLAFLFATLWKATSPSYMDGSLFHFLLVADDRFFGIAHVLGDFSPEMLRDNTAARQEMLRLAPLVQFRETADIRWIANALTVWTLVIEALIAAVFLMPAPASIVKWRHLVLIVFAVSTYTLVPVGAFAWILLIMGVAQCPRDHAKTRLCYLVVFVIVIALNNQMFRQAMFEQLLG